MSRKAKSDNVLHVAQLHEQHQTHYAKHEQQGTPTKIILQGKSNYAGWTKIIEHKLISEGCLTVGKFVEAKEEKSLCIIFLY